MSRTEKAWCVYVILLRNAERRKMWLWAESMCVAVGHVYFLYANLTELKKKKKIMIRIKHICRSTPVLSTSSFFNSCVCVHSKHILWSDSEIFFSSCSANVEEFLPALYLAWRHDPDSYGCSVPQKIQSKLPSPNTVWLPVWQNASHASTPTLSQVPSLIE